jgi:hypothetical protein
VAAAEDRAWGILIHLLKPLSINVTAKEQVAAGNESPDLYCSNARAIFLKASPGFPTTHATVFEIVTVYRLHQSTATTFCRSSELLNTC